MPLALVRAVVAVGGEPVRITRGSGFHIIAITGSGGRILHGPCASLSP